MGTAPIVIAVPVNAAEEDVKLQLQILQKILKIQLIHQATVQNPTRVPLLQQLPALSVV